MQKPEPLSGEKSAVTAAIEALIDEVNSRADPHEELKFAVVVADAWTIENGMLTPTMKIKRNVIEAYYEDQVDAWYDAGLTVIFAQGA